MAYPSGDQTSTGGWTYGSSPGASTSSDSSTSTGATGGSTGSTTGGSTGGAKTNDNNQNPFASLASAFQTPPDYIKQSRDWLNFMMGTEYPFQNAMQQQWQNFMVGNEYPFQNRSNEQWQNAQIGLANNQADMQNALAWSQLTGQAGGAPTLDAQNLMNYYALQSGNQGLNYAQTLAQLAGQYGADQTALGQAGMGLAGQLGQVQGALGQAGMGLAGQYAGADVANNQNFANLAAQLANTQAQMAQSPLVAWYTARGMAPPASALTPNLQDTLSTLNQYGLAQSPDLGQGLAQLGAAGLTEAPSVGQSLGQLSQYGLTQGPNMAQTLAETPGLNFTPTAPRWQFSTAAPPVSPLSGVNGPDLNAGMNGGAMGPLNAAGGGGSNVVNTGANPGGPGYNGTSNPGASINGVGSPNQGNNAAAGLGAMNGSNGWGNAYGGMGNTLNTQAKSGPNQLVYGGTNGLLYNQGLGDTGQEWAPMAQAIQGAGTPQQAAAGLEHLGLAAPIANAVAQQAVGRNLDAGSLRDIIQTAVDSYNRGGPQALGAMGAANVGGTALRAPMDAATGVRSGALQAPGFGGPMRMGLANENVGSNALRAPGFANQLGAAQTMPMQGGIGQMPAQPIGAAQASPMQGQMSLQAPPWAQSLASGLPLPAYSAPGGVQLPSAQMWNSYTPEEKAAVAQLQNSVNGLSPAALQQMMMQSSPQWGDLGIGYYQGY